MKYLLFFLPFCLPFSALAQIISTVTSDKEHYEYGEIINITMSVTNNSVDSVVTYEGPSSHQVAVQSFSGMGLYNSIVTTDIMRDTLHLGQTREVRWQFDPAKLALPNKDGEQTVILRTLNVVDSVKFNAPKFIGGIINVYFEDSTDTAVINAIKDSLDATEMRVNHPSYTWSIGNFMADSVVTSLNNRAYVDLARIPWRGSVVPISNVLTNTEVISEIPNLTLSQNYPNPFNPTTTIDFTLEQASFVELSIYDLMGRKVKELANRKYLQGEQSILFEAGNLSSGTYIYKLKTQYGTIAKKLTLIK